MCSIRSYALSAEEKRHLKIIIIPEKYIWCLLCGGYPDLSDFVPFTQDVTQEELDSVEKKGYRIVKLDNAEKYGIKYLSFWFCRRIEKRDEKTYLRHVYPVVEDIEHTGTGICCFVSSEGNKTYYYLEDVDLAETLEQMRAPEYCEDSHITKAEGKK